jgi:hypothetical protein
VTLADKHLTEGHRQCFSEIVKMTVIEVRCCDQQYSVVTRTVETTLSCGMVPPAIGWFSRSDWQRGIDIVVIDPIPQDLPSLGS